MAYSPLSPVLQALWRLVRYLFGRVRVADAEEGVAVVELKAVGKDPIIAKADVQTFMPDTAGVPGLALSSMPLAAALTPKSKSVAAVPLVVPEIIITPPSDEKDLKLTTERARRPTNVLQATTANAPRRVHGRAPRKYAKDGKENLALHPNAPRCPQPRPAPISLYAPPSKARAQAHVPAPSTRARIAPAAVESATAQPGSSAWDLAKAVQLEQGRKWSAEVTRRHHRRSLPTPPAVHVPLARSASLPLARSTSTPRSLPCAPIQVASRAPPPVRLPLAERLQRACKPPVTEPLPVARLWGDANASFVLGFEDEDEDENEEEEEEAQHKNVSKPALSSSSSGSITGILNALEDDLVHSPAWLGRRRFSGLDLGC
ncbi:hypothetical protein DFH06DRAFT_1482260 [Mycena polygramma]|nr:hypothetical protein DFH06DRAFT_1482260 [Mycena polygramma]